MNYCGKDLQYASGSNICKMSKRRFHRALFFGCDILVKGFILVYLYAYKRNLSTNPDVVTTFLTESSKIFVYVLIFVCLLISTI